MAETRVITPMTDLEWFRKDMEQVVNWLERAFKDAPNDTIRRQVQTLSTRARLVELEARPLLTPDAIAAYLGGAK